MATVTTIIVKLTRDFIHKKKKKKKTGARKKNKHYIPLITELRLLSNGLNAHKDIVL